MRTILISLFFGAVALAQPPNPVRNVTSAPSGPCTGAAPMQKVISGADQGKVYICSAGNTWAQLGGSGGISIPNCTATTADMGATYTATCTPALTSYTDGQLLNVTFPPVPNLGASTINFDMLGAIPVYTGNNSISVVNAGAINFQSGVIGSGTALMRVTLTSLSPSPVVMLQNAPTVPPTADVLIGDSAGNAADSGVPITGFWVTNGTSKIGSAFSLDTQGDPSLGSCGTSPGRDGNNLGGTITVGSGAPTTCELDFSAPYSLAHSMSCVGNTEQAILGVGISMIDTSHVVFALTGVPAKIYYHCWPIE